MFRKRNALAFEMTCISRFTRIHELNSIFLRQRFNWLDLKTSKRFVDALLPVSQIRCSLFLHCIEMRKNNCNKMYVPSGGE